MRILVYGAGVIGCELAHELCKTDHEVTLLARGAWKRTIDRKGLVIHHYVQFRTTTDEIRTIERLMPEDRYDCIFVVMQYEQMQDVLNVLAANVSRYIVLVGNNVTPAAYEKWIIDRTETLKEIAFGFLGTSGSRERWRVISVHKNVDFTVGAWTGLMSKSFADCIEEAFNESDVNLLWEEEMQGWLLSHLAYFLPLSYVCYTHDCNMKYTSKEEVEMIFDSVEEAHELLETLGIPIRPDDEEDYFTRERRKNMIKLYLMARTPIAKLAIGDHCSHAVSEMRALDQGFFEYRRRGKIDMPVWDELRSGSGIFRRVD